MSKYSESESDSAPEEEGFFESHNDNSHGTKKKNNKHAPKETKNIHRPVSVVREIPGLTIPDKYKEPNMKYDLRFNTALGKSLDFEEIRKRYSFLDDIRQKEINEMEKILKNKKLLSRMEEEEIEELKYKLQSLKSKVESLKKKDREIEVLKNYNKDMKEKGENKFLTRAEKRKVLLVDRFKNMNSKQKNKSIERKRKRKLGKEMRSLEFSRQ